MIDPNNPINLNPQDVSKANDSQVDPSFLPKDSNVYIRTMNADLSNLKNSGGESLPYVENPVVNTGFNNINNVPQNNTPVNTPSVDLGSAIPKTEIPINTEIPNKPSEIEVPDFANLNQVLGPAPIAPTPIVTEAVPTNTEPTTLENIKNKIDNLNVAPIAKIKDNANINNLSSNLNANLNDLIMPEEFSPIANVEQTQISTKSKSKILPLLLILGLAIAITLVFMFIIRPKMLSPKVSLKTNSENLLMPATSITTTTTKASPFIPLNSGFQLNNLNIDISKSQEIVNQIKTEANNLLSPGEFKVITPKIKDQFMTSGEILSAFIDNAPMSLVEYLNDKYLVYSFYGEVHPSLGLVFKIKSDATETIKTDFMS